MFIQISTHGIIAISAIIGLILGIVSYIAISLYQSMQEQRKMENDLIQDFHKGEDNTIKNKIVSNIVEAVKEDAIKKEIYAGVNYENTAKTDSIKNIATKIREHNITAKTDEEENEFWVWVDSEVAKMSDDERNELGKLINK